MDNNNKERIGKILRELREARQMTQEQLAALIDKTAGTIGQIERGDIYPNYETLAKIIHVLDADANLFFFKEMPNHPDLSGWMSDAFFGMTVNERKDIGSFLAKFSHVMLKETDDSHVKRDPHS
jgi:transcriptional regulator with XRE-family HTH domain